MTLYYSTEYDTNEDEKRQQQATLDLISTSLWSYLYSYLGLCVTDPTFCLLMTMMKILMLKMMTDHNADIYGDDVMLGGFNCSYDYGNDDGW